jgi:hypothetical protein
MRQFKWIEWNLQKIDAHGLSAEEIERTQMPTSEVEQRSPGRKASDEQIAEEPPFTPPELPPNASASPVEAHLARRRQPLAVSGVVENGLVRPLDPAIKLPERARVIIVLSEAT